MFDLSKFAKVVEDRINPVLIENEKCIRNRSPLSKCNLCEDICFNNSIDIKNKKINLKDNCIECGLCASVCPTSAISIQEPTEISLYNKIERIGVHEGTVILGCSLNDKLHSKALKVPCLGALSLPFLLAINALSFPIHILYNEDQCKNCFVKNGIENYFNKINQIKDIQEELGIDINKIEHNHLPKKIKSPKIDHKGIDYDRRKFFNAVFDQIKKVPDTVVKELVGTPTKKGKGISQVSSIKTNHLNLLSRYMENIHIEEEKELKFFYKPYVVDDCQFCGACSILCPVGAMKYIEDEEKLLLKEDICTGCGLCTTVCYYKALKLGFKKTTGLNSNNPVLLTKKHE